MGSPILDPEDVVYAPTELAAVWKVHKQTVLNLIHTGKLDAFSVGENYRITRLSVESFIRLHPVTGDGKRQPRRRSKKG